MLVKIGTTKWAFKNLNLFEIFIQVLDSPMNSSHTGEILRVQRDGSSYKAKGTQQGL